MVTTKWKWKGEAQTQGAAMAAQVPCQSENTLTHTDDHLAGEYKWGVFEASL